jgi:hypothetical protein
LDDHRQGWQLLRRSADVSGPGQTSEYFQLRGVEGSFRLQTDPGWRDFRGTPEILDGQLRVSSASDVGPSLFRIRPVLNREARTFSGAFLCQEPFRSAGQIFLEFGQLTSSEVSFQLAYRHQGGEELSVAILVSGAVEAVAVVASVVREVAREVKWC